MNEYKMPLSELKAMFPKPSSHYIENRDKKRVVGATHKSCRHIVNPVWLPAKADIPPAKYRQQHLGKRKKK